MIMTKERFEEITKEARDANEKHEIAREDDTHGQYYCDSSLHDDVEEHRQELIEEVQRIRDFIHQHYPRCGKTCVHGCCEFAESVMKVALPTDDRPVRRLYNIL